MEKLLWPKTVLASFMMSQPISYLFIIPHQNSLTALIIQKKTPDQQAIKHLELKGQMSCLLPLHLLVSPFDLGGSYTPLMYWQLHANLAYFRETNDEARLFINNYPQHNWLFSKEMVPPSNDRSGIRPNSMECRWNLASLNIMSCAEKWIVIQQPRIPILQHWSSDLHNSDISHNMGDGRMVAADRFHAQELSLMLRNQIKSGFKRGAIEVDYAFPPYKELHGLEQVGSGYGQGLIEYNHHTTSVGQGIALSNWI